MRVSYSVRTYINTQYMNIAKQHIELLKLRVLYLLHQRSNPSPSDVAATAQVAQKLFVEGMCVVPGDGRVWKRIFGDSISFGFMPEAIGCTKLCLDVNKFIHTTNQTFKDDLDLEDEQCDSKDWDTVTMRNPDGVPQNTGTDQLARLRIDMLYSGWASEDRLINPAGHCRSYAVWFKRWDWHGRMLVGDPASYYAQGSVDKGLLDVTRRAAEIASRAWAHFSDAPPVQCMDSSLMRSQSNKHRSSPA